MSHNNFNPFENVKLTGKCPVDWKSMPGDAVSRQCTECLLHVYDLSNLSEVEAKALFRKHSKRPSNTLFRRPDGFYMTKDCPAGVLRSLFGPTQNEIWRQVSDEIDGRCIQDGSEKNRLGRAVIEVEHPPWILKLDTYTKTHGRSTIEMTRLRIPFVNASGLNLLVYPKTSISDLGKYFGMQDIIVGDALFDYRMIIQGNELERIKNIFTDSTLCNMLLSLDSDLCTLSPGIQPYMLLTVQEDDGEFRKRFRGGIDVLYFECCGVLKDKRVLKNIIAMSAELIDQLVRVGTAVPRK